MDGRGAALAGMLLPFKHEEVRLGSVRPAVWMAIVKILPPIGEVNSPLLSTYAISAPLLTFTLTSAI
jgi:hypothetical protein